MGSLLRLAILLAACTDIPKYVAQMSDSLTVALLYCAMSKKTVCIPLLHLRSGWPWQLY